MWWWYESRQDNRADWGARPSPAIDLLVPTINRCGVEPQLGKIGGGIGWRDGRGGRAPRTVAELPAYFAHTRPRDAEPGRQYAALRERAEHCFEQVGRAASLANGPSAACCGIVAS